jgi:hypothetical protein
VDPRTRSLVRTGVVGAIVTFLCIGVLFVYAVPPFVPADESSHAGYALRVTDGEIPKVDELVEVELPGQRPTRYFTANHPPLYYVLAGPVLRWGRDSGHPFAGIRVTRGLSVLLGGAGVVLAALFAGIVLRAFRTGERRRAQAMVLVAGLVATVPTYVFTASFIHNDMLGVATLVLAYVGAAAALVDRPRPGNVAVAAVGSALTMATRFSGLGIVALCCGALACAGLWRTTGSLRRRLLNAAGLALVPVATVLVTSGWFYLRNKREYGDFAGINGNIEFLHRVDKYTPLSYLTDPQTLPDLFVRTENAGGWGSFPYFGWYERKVLALVVAVVAVGAVLGLVRFVRSRGWSGVQWPQLAVVGFVVAMPLVAVVQLAGFVAQTGAPHPRYLFGVLPAIAIGVALALLAFRGRWGAMLGVAIVAVQAAVTVTTVGRWIRIRTDAAPVHPLTELRDALGAGGVGRPRTVLGVLLAGALVGLVLQAVALWRLSSEASAPSADGAGEPDGEPEDAPERASTTHTAQAAATAPVGTAGIT